MIIGLIQIYLIVTGIASFCCHLPCQGDDNMNLIITERNDHWIIID